MSNIIPAEIIEKKIYLIREHKVMLDKDLAELYGVETRALNQAVRRNIDRFPDDFMFSLNREEIMNLSQFVISSNIKHAPNVFAFTEQGVAMLSSVLRSKRAVDVNIEIMRSFVRLRIVLSPHKELTKKIDSMEKKYDAQFRAVFDAIRQLIATPAENAKKIIGFGKEE
ncbi:MAG: ORF6N domain-containing protein [Thermodesulfovibrionia bacterium]|nr:ORF6N domain-containing protein [Thermodesulfovibrionia bacterium]